MQGLIDQFEGSISNVEQNMMINLMDLPANTDTVYIIGALDLEKSGMLDIYQQKIRDLPCIYLLPGPNYDGPLKDIKNRAREALRCLQWAAHIVWFSSQERAIVHGGEYFIDHSPNFKNASYAVVCS